MVAVGSVKDGGIKGGRVGALLFSLEHHLQIYCSKKPANAKPSLRKKKHRGFYVTFKIFQGWAWVVVAVVLAEAWLSIPKSTSRQRRQQ